MGNAFLYGAGGGGGGKTKNVVSIWNGDTGAVITATLGTKTKIAETDASGYAFFTNLDVGTWTLQATKTGKSVGPKSITIVASQTAYYVKYPFRTYAYDGSLYSSGQHGANVCESFSGGWAGAGGGGVITYGDSYVRWLGDSAYVHYLYNVTPIDLTPFNTLHISCKGNRSGVKAGIINANNTDWVAYVTTSSNSQEEISVDVSNFEDVAGRICFGGVSNIDLYIYSAWFE